MPETLTDAQKVLRNDTGKRIAAALETLASEVELPTVIAPEYDATQTYAVGDLVIYRGVLYRCTTAIITPEEWTAARWTDVTVADELADKYEKPTGGIPKNDLAAGVQTSLDKADTAIQLGLSGASVGDLVRVASVDANGKPTSWKHVPLNEIKCNKNLLDNWYFVGGGSQLGYGVFPINQRGQTTYSNSGYGIDRWRSDPIELTESYIRTVGIVQVFDHSKYVGQKMTASALYSDGRLLTGTAIVQPVGYNTVFLNYINGNLIRLSEYWKGFQVVATDSTTRDIIAVKLELGSEQTIAHNEGTEENPVWVLNEIPDYGEELRKCQRYYQLFRTESLRPTYGEDCRPTMATEQPTKGTLTKGGVTYYTLSSEP